jgi:taurine--2-oxoglutarate transaminase
MASIVATLDVMEADGIVQNAATVGATAICPALAELAERHPLIGEVRGEGVFWAIELVADRATREPAPATVMAAIKSGLLERGLLPFIQDNRIHVVPPCIVTADEVAEAVAIYDETLSAVEAA